MDNKVHVFEQAGLGKAPFAYVDYFQGKAYADEFTGSQDCTTCAYCYTSISACFRIKSSDGKEFIVGSTCVTKTGDKGLINLVKRAISKQKAQEFQAKWKELKVKILARDPEIVKVLDAQPHPYYPSVKTMFDYADYQARNYAWDTSIKKIFKALK